MNQPPGRESILPTREQIDLFVGRHPILGTGGYDPNGGFHYHYQLVQSSILFNSNWILKCDAKNRSKATREAM